MLISFRYSFRFVSLPALLSMKRNELFVSDSETESEPWHLFSSVRHPLPWKKTRANTSCRHATPCAGRATRPLVPCPAPGAMRVATRFRSLKNAPNEPAAPHSHRGRAFGPRATGQRRRRCGRRGGQGQRRCGPKPAIRGPTGGSAREGQERAGQQSGRRRYKPAASFAC